MENRPTIQINMPNSAGSPQKSPAPKIALIIFAIIFVLGLILGILRVVRLGAGKYNDSRPKVINTLPMYGGFAKNELEQKADQDFVNTMSAALGGRRGAAEGVVNGAWQFFNQGDYETAMKRFNQAWLLDWNNADVYKGYINMASKQNSVNELYTYTQKVVVQNPQQATIQCFLGVVDVGLVLNNPDQQKDYLNRAETEFQKGLAIEDKNPFCHLNLAAALYHNEKYADAWNHLLINFNLPDARLDAFLIIGVYDKTKLLISADSYSMVGIAYARLARDNESFDVFDKGTARYPQDVSLNCNLASVYVIKWYNDPYRNGSYLAQSEKYFKAGLTIDPNSGLCHAKYAGLLYNQSKFEQAWQEIKKARGLGWNEFNADFLKKMEEAFPEPKQ